MMEYFLDKNGLSHLRDHFERSSMEEFVDDTHFCLKCHITIIGLENYVNHRKSNCMKQVADHQKSPLLTTDESFTLKADDFFSSLELQSSSKKLIQPSTSGKTSSGILTRSKVTGYTREVPEPSKSGKNAWIGGHQLKELEYDDNQSKLIKAVANLERRKEDVGRSKGISNLQVYEESDDEYEDYDYDDETSDEDAPPRNHTGGKWKPSSPIYWKSSQPERDWRSPPPTFTGGKWKPTPTKRIVSPPPTHTKGKWKPGHQPGKDIDDAPPPSFTGSKWSQSKKQEYSLNISDCNKGKFKSKSDTQIKWDNDYPPPEHTKGKWKPESSPDPIPSTYTKGKWKPPNLEEELISKEASENYAKDGWNTPSKSTEKRQNSKLSEDSPLRKSGGTVQYWCRPCDRRLASKIVYERHLKSEFHFKRMLRENELEESLNFVRDERRTKKKSVEVMDETETVDSRKKKTRRKTFKKCQVCNSRVNETLMGKHLISHYHCRKGDLSSELSQKLVLEYIGSIILQSPFQCLCCRFFFNTHKDFLDHWLSEIHEMNVLQKSGTFFCSYCHFSCEENEEMYHHLISEGHNEVVSVINRSVPIVIRRVNYKHCATCNEKFLLNIQLIKHMEKLGHNTPGSFNEDEHVCDSCRQTFNSRISLQRHKMNTHSEKSFICGTCGLTFANAETARVHRNSEQHYYSVQQKKNAADKNILQKKCQHCSETFENFLKLKEHIKIEHEEFHSRCPQCGMMFIIPQELSVHLRTKSCKFEVEQSSKKYICRKCSFSSDSSAQMLFHEVLHGDPVLIYSEKPHSSDKKPTPHYKCPKCPRFFSKSSLECHLRIHTKERPYTCSYCKATFIRKNNLLYHEKKHSSGKIVANVKVSADTVKPFLCSMCGASFKKRFVLQQHMSIHTGKRYKCIEAECMFAGRSFGELKTHYQTHFDDRNYKCQLCDYKGKTKQQLRRHTTIHEQMKKFKCPSCPFTARTTHHLKRHSRLHTGSKPYSCPHCTYKCNSLENLRKHVLSTNKHPGKSIYECKVCKGNSFQTNLFKEFKAHLLTMHPEETEGRESMDSTAGVYEAERDSFFSFGSSNKPNEISEQSNAEILGIQISQDGSLTTSSVPNSTQVHSSSVDEVLPVISLPVSKQEDIQDESETENWSMVECYDVEESGALVPFSKDETEDTLFEEHF